MVRELGSLSDSSPAASPSLTFYRRRQTQRLIRYIRDYKATTLGSSTTPAPLTRSLRGLPGLGSSALYWSQRALTRAARSQSTIQGTTGSILTRNVSVVHLSVVIRTEQCNKRRTATASVEPHGRCYDEYKCRDKIVITAGYFN